MSSSGITGRAGGLRLFDLVALVAAMPIATDAYERLAPERAWVPPLDVLLPSIALVVMAWGASAWLHQLYEAPLGSSRVDHALRVVRTLATVAVVLAALGFVTRQTELSRLLVGLYFAVAFALTIGARLAWRVAAAATRGGDAARRFAIVGTGGMAREVVETVDAHPEWGLRFAGFIRIDGNATGSRGPFLGTVAQLGRILEEEIIDVVVFAVPRERLGEVERAVHVCEEQGVEVRISLDILRFGPGRMTVADMDGVPMLAFTRTPQDALALGVKRAFDIVMSAAVIVLLAPVFLAIAAAVRLDSPGPIFFRQRRVGQNGRLFDMLKFRSMYQDAEARLEALRAQNEMSGPVFKMANDPRVTRVGRFLRKTSLDEFPQFWNVLRGEMSIVGPRPPIPAEVRQYKRWQRRRLSMKPGITCIWQISGRNNIDFDRWMELDLQYIDEWSLWGDIQICFKTIPAVLSARGAR
jgi:exopolysaccharide biosynthesis polyprenyl glycosylphosphotransferase